jgi:hypothetical protein
VIQGPRFSGLTVMRSSESIGVVVLLIAQQAGILVLHAAHAKVAGESDPGSGLIAQLVSEGCHHQLNTVCNTVPGSLQLLAHRNYTRPLLFPAGKETLNAFCN